MHFFFQMEYPQGDLVGFKYLYTGTVDSGVLGGE